MVMALILNRTEVCPSAILYFIVVVAAASSSHQASPTPTTPQLTVKQAASLPLNHSTPFFFRPSHCHHFNETQYFFLSRIFFSMSQPFSFTIKILGITVFIFYSIVLLLTTFLQATYKHDKTTMILPSLTPQIYCHSCTRHVASIF